MSALTELLLLGTVLLDAQCDTGRNGSAAPKHERQVVRNILNKFAAD
jgi:hypothetical protein